MTGVSAQDAYLKDIQEVVILHDQSGFPFDIKAQCFLSKNLEVSGLVLKNHDRDYYINYGSSIIEQQGGKRESLITLTDVTTEKMLEKTKDEFISVASHELRTPMTIIKSYLWMVLAGKSGEVNPGMQSYLTKAMKATERMISLINDILSAAKLEQDKVLFDNDIIEIDSYAMEIISDFTIKAQEKGIYLNFEPSGTKSYVTADSGKLREIFVNLLGNAVKFTRQGGVTVKIKDEGSQFKIEIADTGSGIEKDDIARLFHKFGRLDSSYQTVAESGGTGLGLYIVKLYIEGMGGKVGAESEGKLKGSTFWFTLPKKPVRA
jgi:signal transduction histidine kinase